MLHKAWSNIEEVPYCFSRSSVEFQGRTALKIVEFDPVWAFPDCNSSLNSPMAMKCCTKLETAKERCPIVFQGHPLNFKVTRYKASPILTQIRRFRTIGQSQLSNPSDLPCFYVFLSFCSYDSFNLLLTWWCHLKWPKWSDEILVHLKNLHRYIHIYKATWCYINWCKEIDTYARWPIYDKLSLSGHYYNKDHLSNCRKSYYKDSIFLMGFPILVKWRVSVEAKHQALLHAILIWIHSA